jgi:hypothetical protein
MIDDHSDLVEARRRLLDHTIYKKVANVESLRSFMKAHVFAVWDFMSLAKRLQRDLTCVSLPWMPPKDREGARLINEITLSEESDSGPDGSPISHLELYVRAMKEVGADTRQFEAFCGLIRQGLSPTCGGALHLWIYRIDDQSVRGPVRQLEKFQRSYPKSTD